MASNVQDMAMTPSDRFLMFILQRGEKFYEIITDPKCTDQQCDIAISAMVAFVPDDQTRADLYKKYFDNRRVMNTKTAALITCGATISALATAMGISETAAAGYI